jgi:hypothetical protein
MFLELALILLSLFLGAALRTRRATRRSARLGKPEIGDRAAGSEEMDEPVGERTISTHSQTLEQDGLDHWRAIRSAA